MQSTHSSPVSEGPPSYENIYSSTVQTAGAKFSSLLSRARKPPQQHWSIVQQPVSLVKMTSQQTSPNSVRYIATGITQEAEQILSQLSAPLYIVAFTGFGRTGKSYVASELRNSLNKAIPGKETKFKSQPGNVPCTHGIDMMVFPHPTGVGNMVFLDCEGGANHNSTAIPFVIGLAARLSSKIYVFERGCFTTAGLDTVMQIVNMGNATTPDDVDITRSLVLVENMTINQEVSELDLLTTLVSELAGDETTNKIRSLIRHRFDLEFVKIPYNAGGNSFQDACNAVCTAMLENLDPFTIANVCVDGPRVIDLANELLMQIRDGGSRYNMVSATEALVANMASEAACTVWIDFIEKVKKSGNHPSQINGKKLLRVTLREIEGIANPCITELEGFINRLQPREPAIIAKLTWERNYQNFEREVCAIHSKKIAETEKLSLWAVRLNNVVTTLLEQVVNAIRQMVQLARFSLALALMSNYYLWQQSCSLVSGMLNGVLAVD